MNHEADNDNALASAIPDLRELPLTDLNSADIAEAEAAYRRRLAKIGLPLSTFNSSI